MNKISYLDLAVANEQIQTTDIKGREYAEVNQRIKAFRMVYPMGTIFTEMISDKDGVCVFKATVSDGLNVLGTGTAYEKENSTFINKTSYIENCETSAVGRALGMAGFGIDTSVASAEEVQNAINNQTVTEEEAKEYTLQFGKHKGKKLNEVPENYIQWLLGNSNDDQLKKMIELATGITIPTEEEQEETFELMTKINKYIQERDFDYENLLRHYGVNSNSEMTLEQLRDAVRKLEG